MAKALNTQQAEIVERYNHARDELLGLLDQVQPEQYNLPTSCEGWTVKDLIAHLTNSAASVRMLMQRQLDKVPNAGAAALNERNRKGVESRKDRSVASLIEELKAEHAQNIEFYQSLTFEQLAIEGALASGEIITVEERFRRAANHYHEHGAMITNAIANA